MKRLGITGVREISTILCVFCILFVFMTGTQTTYAQETAKITVSSDTDGKGETAEVSFHLTGNPGI